MNDKELCPICGEGHVTDHVDQVESEYKGKAAMLPMHYQVCDTCHSDFAGAAEGKKNKRAIMAFRKSVDGLLTGAEIVALRKKYKLTQDQAAKLFGGGPVAFSKYENDDVSQSESMDSLLRLIRRSEAAFWELADEKGLLAELKPPKAAEVADLAGVRVQTTNIVAMADFRGVSFQKSAKKSFTFSTESTHSTDSKKWK
ncbi:MAG: type II toxin-antitoxin system MqsA family antitoxin [Pseudomonadota bacterium]